VLVLFVFILVLAAGSTLASFIWERDVNEFGARHWYLAGLPADYPATYFSYGSPLFINFSYSV
jgi:hypothetical protein